MGMGMVQWQDGTFLVGTSGSLAMVLQRTALHFDDLGSG